MDIFTSTYWLYRLGCLACLSFWLFTIALGISMILVISSTYVDNFNTWFDKQHLHYKLIHYYISPFFLAVLLSGWLWQVTPSESDIKLQLAYNIVDKGKSHPAYNKASEYITLIFTDMNKRK